MKRLSQLIFILVFVLLGSLQLRAQIIPSVCEVNDSTKESFKWNVLNITHFMIQKSNSLYKDSAEIPGSLIDSVYHAYSAVYNDTNSAERDTIFKHLNIKEYPNYFLDHIAIYADTNAPWIKAVLKGNIPTGFASFDSIISLYGMTLYKSYGPFFSTDYWYLIYKLGDFYNVNAIIKSLSSINGIQQAELVGGIGDGDKIECEFNSSYTTLKFYYKWGDCPSGCMYHRMWQFNIYPDCGVEFKGSSGSVIPRVGLSDVSIKPVHVSPNPFTSEIHVEGINEDVAYAILDINGQQLKKGFIQNQRISNLDELDYGVYLLYINTNNNISAPIKLIK